MIKNSVRYRDVLIFLLAFNVITYSNVFGVLGIEETVEMSMLQEPIRFEASAWQGNPDARSEIYKLAKESDMFPRASMLSYIGIIGDNSDIPILLSFLPASTTEFVDLDPFIASGIFSALANLSNRGFSEAGDIIGEMTNPQYWKDRKLGYSRFSKPFQMVSEEVLSVYGYAGLDDFEQRLTTFLQTIDDSSRKTEKGKYLREHYEHIVNREKEMGTWKVRGCPENLAPQRGCCNHARHVTEVYEVSKPIRRYRTLKSIDTIFSRDFSALSPESFSNDADPEIVNGILMKVKNKQKDEKIFKEIVFLGLLPEVVVASEIQEYINFISKYPREEERKLIVASLYSLGLLALQGDVVAQHTLQEMGSPVYWKKQNVDIYNGKEEHPEYLASENTLALVAFLSFEFFFLARTVEQVDIYLDTVKVKGMQREIMKSILHICVRDYIDSSAMCSEGKNPIGRRFDMKLFDRLLEIITPPVTANSILEPNPVM
jgi:hypothetical protein